MKLTRNKLKQLINEALKPFFMGVSPTDLINRLRMDKSINPKISNLLNHEDPEMQRVGINLLMGTASEETLSKYPELAGKEDYLDLDLTTRSQAGYKKEFGKALSRMAPMTIKQIASSILPDVEYFEMPGYYVKVFTNDPQAGEEFVKEIKKQGLGNFLTYSITPEALDAAHRGTYVMGPARSPQAKYHGMGAVKQKRPEYEIELGFVNPQWWRGAEIAQGRFPSY